MRVIENINTLIRFISYFIPLFVLLISRFAIFDYIDTLRTYHQDLWILIVKLGYYGLVLLAALFALMALYKLLKVNNKKRYKSCCEQLTLESKIKIAKLAEVDDQIELYFTDNSHWLEQDIEKFIEMYSREIGIPDFEQFVHFVNDRAVVYFSHRVSQRKQFLNILNRL